MKIIKILIKIIVFKLFPHVKNYHERISNIEIAISAVAEYSGNFNDSSALNKQLKRREIVENILNLYSPKLIVETGTHLGDSTGFFSRFCEKVCTSDLSPIYMWAAKTRLAEFNNIDFFIGDSREFLKKIVVISELKSQLTFFYLDAHWHEDLPLYEEIKLIIENWSVGNWILLIDDFCVPGDSGYAYPSYGHNKTLNFQYISKLVEKYNLEVFFPTIPSSIETGYKTGYVFISNGGFASDVLSKTKDISLFH